MVLKIQGVLLTVLLLFGVLFSAAAGLENEKAPGVGNSGPVVATPELRFEFGSVVEGVYAEHDFVVENNGDADLVIEKVEPG